MTLQGVSTTVLGHRYSPVSRICAHPSGEMGVRSSGGTLSPSLWRCMAEVKGVPVDDDDGKEVQAGYAEVLAFGGAVADFALTADAQGVLERVVRFALRTIQATMAHRDTSVSELCRELGITPVTLYRYVDPQGNLRDHGKRVIGAWLRARRGRALPGFSAGFRLRNR